ncbi:CHAT domain-containing protein [Nonomuraea angiospora]|uniref:CHAT domain-containing protein n=1 Tax=Nonomuraea angiospora TaxID=46172 RepID=UPI0029AFF987|nr:CHAT domain-containing protein [Nonomuraea angiospora]MDX3099842.1 CHAT domain-containing protein [Nonomuraea angiospora]
MGVNETQRQLNHKRDQRIAADRKAGEFRRKESEARAKAAKARAAAAKTSSTTTMNSKLREAEREEKAAATAGKSAGEWSKKAADYGKAEGKLEEKLTKERASEEAAAERRRQLVQKRAELAHRTENASLHHRINETEIKMIHAIRELRAPKPEKLRVLLLGATTDGGLRIGREQKRIRAAVNAAIHRDAVELDPRPAATTADLLDGLSSFKPHVVHFSGHSDENFIVLEEDIDEEHEFGVDVAAGTFARAMAAPDEPPLLVMFNSCTSAPLAEALVAAGVVPFAIGMSDEVEDTDAIAYAAQFYAAITDGNSIQSAHDLAVVGLELSGLAGVDLPQLACAPNVDPAQTFLVKKLT